MLGGVSGVSVYVCARPRVRARTCACSCACAASVRMFVCVRLLAVTTFKLAAHRACRALGGGWLTIGSRALPKQRARAPIGNHPPGEMEDEQD